ncbi:MAG: hypothetical protein ACRDO8_00155, partial [Nocardioidaceae bacterium]
MSAQSIVPVVIGLALLVFSASCWTLRVRWWTQTSLPVIAIALVPAVGVTMIAIGLGAALESSSAAGVVYVVGTLVLVPAAVITVWNPSWYGPTWYRAERR